MLQQTRVETVGPYYARFLERFPTVRALASADPSSVLALWAGLGYYRRARNLHEAARRVVEAHGGELPRDRAALRALPGVGEYTSSAIASIAFGEAVPAIDGNVIRVLSRWHVVRQDPRRGAARAKLESLARRYVEGAPNPGEWNQALMDLGALTCLPKVPRCDACPVASDCGARRRGIESQLPALAARPETVAVNEAAAVVTRGGAYLFVQRAAEGRLAGLYEFPTVEIVGEGTARRRLADYVRERAGLEVELGDSIADVRHAITKHRIRLRAFTGYIKGDFPGRGLWFTSAEARAKGLTAASRKVLDRVEASRFQNSRRSARETRH